MFQGAELLAEIAFWFIIYINWNIDFTKFPGIQFLDSLLYIHHEKWF